MLSFNKISQIIGFAAAMALTATPGLSADNAPSGDAPRAAGEATGNPVIESYTFSGAHDVFQFLATTPGGRMRVETRDCCIVGDKWSTRTYCLQNNSVTDVRGKGSGSISAWTGLTDVYKNGAQPIQCIVEVRYAQGVSVFPAGMSVRVSGPTTLTTTRLTTLQPLVSQ
jgi:hypothetical protein